MEQYISEREVYKKVIWKGIPYWVLNELGEYHFLVIYANDQPQHPFLLFVMDNACLIETYPEGILVETLRVPKPKKKEGKVTDHIQLCKVKTHGFLYVGDREYLLLQSASDGFNSHGNKKVFLVTPNQVVASGKDNEGEVIWAFGSPREVTINGDYIIDEARTIPAIVRFYEDTNKSRITFMEE